MQSEFNILSKISGLVAEVQNDISGIPVFADLYQDFSSVPKRMEEPMQLAIVGKISSSKSTLVNAILGQPEVVRTGAMEETWNVSWLKYGDPGNDIVVHFKDGGTENVSRRKWSEWANRKREENDLLKNTVSYIEVTYNHEILKSINIIDTPGLDSFYGADSQNTLDFLNQVRPDAVIMLFSKSINADTLGIIEDFRQGVGNGFLPINAMGVMSKIDEIWVSDPELEPVKEARRVIGALKSQEVVKNTLFDIYPISALVALSAFCITPDDLLHFGQLASLNEERFGKMLKSEKRFLASYEDMNVSEEKREYLLLKYGRYGIHLIVEFIRNKKEATSDDLRTMLLQKSGFNEFIEVVSSHFGERATLIKIYSSIFRLSVRCHKLGDTLRKKLDEVSYTNRLIIDKVIRKIEDLMSVLSVEFQQVGILIEMYEGKLEMSPEEYEELRRVCGEYGPSCMDRTGLADATVEQMEERVTERIAYWAGAYNSVGDLFPTQARFMKLLIKSYNLLLGDIKTAKYKLDSATQFLFGK